MKIQAEIGSFSHYKDPRQIIKLAGLTLRENSSGQDKGKTEKFDKVMMLVSQYEITENDINQFSNELTSSFKNREYLKQPNKSIAKHSIIIYLV